MFKAYMSKNDATVQSQATSLCNLQIHMGQLATDLKNRPYEALPSDIELPKRDGKDQCKVLTLRNGKALSPAHPNAPRLHNESTRDEWCELQTEEECETDRTPSHMLVEKNTKQLVNSIEQTVGTQDDTSEEVDPLEAKVADVGTYHVHTSEK